MNKLILFLLMVIGFTSKMIAKDYELNVGYGFSAGPFSINESNLCNTISLSSNIYI